jgi:putative ABC transport system substrate-binding protein
VLHELIPSVTKFAFLSDPGLSWVGEIQTRNLKAAADSLGLSLLNVKAHSPDEFEAAFETAARAGAGAIVIGADPLFIADPRLVALADRYHLPAIYNDDGQVKAGGLISYGADHDDAQRLVGNYAGRILNGEKPTDMPVQQSTKVILMINLKTAAAMGITVPISLLGRADELVE